ncbi:hypothetical protein [Clostridium perfringens]|uniref:hypothetical protein n=1 Tax=Clostridium perfringens TaxID=1502 RepID=UPI001ABAAF26|nr:hypothetical protein [Clostridium perfringens]MBO3375523.1 hypothetical protein [Clostridium perfringens]
MLKDLNEKIKECRENMALKEILEKRNLSLENELNSKEKELGELEKRLNKELKDVQKLKSLSFSNLISNILRNKDEKLEKEEREYLEAKLKYDNFKFKVEKLRYDVEENNNRLGQLINIEGKYKDLISEKRELVKKFNLNIRDEIIEIENEIKDLLSNKTEISEALREANNCLMISEETLKSLMSAKNWGIYDIVGGGMISSAIKHNRIDDAKTYMERLSYSVDRLNKELGDVDTSIFNEGLNISGFSYTFDIFFDNIFSDFSVQGEINDSLYKIEDFRNKVLNLIRKLEEKENSVGLKANLLNDKLERLIEEN